ncbi:MAG TPA: SGNH/GDSL hydrolase family protein, partial [Gemmataceae bacterium]|nr:SGNH/GDSL hydrolase family protein [Gemmataceae bacterium]
MRNPRSPAWARSAAFAAALTFAVAGHAPDAGAQSKYQQLFVFGDSYADLTLSDSPAANPQAPPGVTLSVWRVYPVPLAANLGNPQIFDFAVGGARASDAGPPPGIPPFWHLHRQVDEFLKTSPTLGPSDLVTLSIAGNDGIGFAGAGGTVADAPAFGAFIAKLTADEIQRLKNAGGQTFVIAAFSGLSGLQIPQIANNPLAADAFGAAYFENLQLNLRPMAQGGTRFFLLDLFRLGQQVEGNLAGYDLVGVKCPGGPPICGGSINSDDQKKYFLGPDGLHLTNRGFEIVADYMANIVMAPDTIAVQPGLVTTTTGGFANSLLNRLGSVRQLSSVPGTSFADPDGPMGLGGKPQAPRPAPASGVTGFA